MRVSLLRFIFTAFVLILIGFIPVTATAQAESPIPNLEVILLIDESDSMLDTDPLDRTLDAVELFINTLGVDLSTADFRVALVAYNDGAKLIGDGFVSLKTQDARQQLIERYRAERPPRERTYTDVVAGLQEARALLNQHQEGYKPIVVILSDGKPETSFANERTAPEGVADYLQRLESLAANEFDGVGYEGAQCSSDANRTPIYTIAIRNGTLEENYPADLKELWLRTASSTGGSYRENITDNDADFQQNLQTIFTDFLREWLCVQVSSAQFMPLPFSQTFELNDSHAQVIFSIAKSDPTAQVQILNAAGQEVFPRAGSVNQNQSGLSESWAILRPEDRVGWSGAWTVNLTGPEGAQASVSPIFITDIIRLNVVSPSVGILPLGADLTVQTEIVDNSGQPISPELILSKNVSIIGPDNQPLAESELQYQPNGKLVSVIPAPTQEGRYQINVNATVAAGEKQLPFQQTRFVELSRLLPWLDMTSPTAGGRYPFSTFIPLEAIFKLHLDELDPAINLKNEVSAELYRINASGAAREPVGRYDLTLQPELGGAGHFGGQLPNDLPAGAYEVDLKLLTQPPGGQEYEAPPVSIAFTIEDLPTPTPPPTALPTALPTATMAPTAPASPTVVIVPTATPTPEPSEPLIFDLPPAILLSCGLLIFLLALGLIVMLFLRNRPSLAMIGIEDVSSYPNANNDTLFNGISSYWSKTVTIRDQNDVELAKLRFMPQDSGPVIEVHSLIEGAQVRVKNFLYGEGDQFYPENGDLIEIGDRSNLVRLRFDAPEKDDYDDEDYYA